MADRKEQVKPLAPAFYLFRSDEEDNTNNDDNKNKSFFADRRRNSCVKRCGCASAILVIAAVTMMILAITVFHVKGPIVKMTSVTVDPLQTYANGTIDTDKNVTLVAGVSVKNPNAASFRYANTTTTVFYGGAAVGEGWNAAGKAKARRTVKMNLTVEISTAKMLESPGLLKDWGSGELTFDSYTRIEGRVKITDVVKKKVVVKLNCTVSYNVSSKGIERQHCKRHVSL
ncbi:hypothetical protein L484_006687 [Morus notabilis]|uniref:Late embryogenesis abundant protein LEA-2 subgroup domain-containing protein n=1 Tax=Morus notabilis TaxID=981085 RepID=W9SLI7_9ROSA|nr:uncharacterized protein LOC21390109 [Morus notabilis]EXC34332.1 hypothetical protein L484_006687 [Morus notabilis]